MKFDLETSEILVDKYTRNQTKENELHHYSSASAYCNGGNTLFISGGINHKANIILSTFWSINLEKEEIKKWNSAITPRQRHSMIYIPSDYVFIIGGSANSLVTEYYDIKSETVKRIGDLNEEKIEPALAYVDDRYLYAFSSGSDLSFERVNLRGSCNWEKIAPQIDEGFVLFQKYFAVSYGMINNTSTILFVGGFNKEESNESLYNAMYDIKDNKLSYSSIGYKEQTFLEKSFLHVKPGVTFGIDNDALLTPQGWFVNQMKAIDCKS